MTETYADLASLKDWLSGTDVMDGRHDSKLGLALLTASRQIDNHCNRTFTLDAEPTERYVRASKQTLFVPDIADAESITLALDTTGEGDYEALEGFAAQPTMPIRRISVYGSTLLPNATVRVTALYGWPSVPEPVEQACLMLAARYFKRHLSPEGLNTVGEFTLRVSVRDPDVEALLAPYKLLGWA